MIALTPTGVEKLDELAAEFSLSHCEFIERIESGFLVWYREYLLRAPIPSFQNIR